MSERDEAPQAEGPSEGPDSSSPPLPGGAGVPGLGELFGEARHHFEQAAYEAGDLEVKGSAGGGAIEIALTGNLEVVSVHIAPEVIDREDPQMLEDLVTAALRDALAEAVAVREEAAASLLPPGLDLGAMLSGLFPAGSGQAPAGLPDLSSIDFGGLDFGELVGGLFGGGEEPDEGEGGPAADEEEGERP